MVLQRIGQDLATKQQYSIVYTYIYMYVNTMSALSVDRRLGCFNILPIANNTTVNTGVREGNGNPLQYSCLENPMDGGAW